MPQFFEETKIENIKIKECQSAQEWLKKTSKDPWNNSQRGK